MDVWIAGHEQGLIELSIQVDVSRSINTAKLPSVTHPDTRIMHNEHDALKLYRGHVKKLNNKLKDKSAVIKFCAVAIFKLR